MYWTSVYELSIYETFIVLQTSDTLKGFEVGMWAKAQFCEVHVTPVTAL